MKVGDLVMVKPKHKFSFNEGLGLIVKVEEGFYAQGPMGEICDRLTIHWMNGNTTKDPCAYVEKLDKQ